MGKASSLLKASAAGYGKVFPGDQPSFAVAQRSKLIKEKQKVVNVSVVLEVFYFQISLKYIVHCPVICISVF